MPELTDDPTMTWHTVAAAGADRHLWVRVTGEGAPPYGPWISPAGHDVRKVLGQRGPAVLDVPVWWAQEAEHRGDRRTDLLWETGMLGLKLMSERMCHLLHECGGTLEVFEGIEIRLRNGDRVSGYVAVLEDTEQPGPVHSLWRGRRSHRLVVSDEVRTALRKARLVGLELEEVDGPFPADRPDFFDD